MAKCAFRHATGERCELEAQEGIGFCPFHVPRDRQRSPSSEHYVSLLLDQLRQGNGDFRGFVFPPNFLMADMTPDVSNVKSINLTNADMSLGASFKNVHFSCPVIFSQIISDRHFVLANCSFNGDVDFSMTDFKSRFLCDSEFHSEATFASCNFRSRTAISGDFYKTVNFRSAVFHDRALFRGKRIIAAKTASGTILQVAQTVVPADVSLNFHSVREFFTSLKIKSTRLRMLAVNKLRAFSNRLGSRSSSFLKSKLDTFALWIDTEWKGNHDGDGVQSRELFHGTVEFGDVDFQRPERISFLNVNLSRANIIGSDFFGVQFYDVNWKQPKLKRNGLHEEVNLINSPDLKYRKYKRPALEEAYRNIRRTLEAQKDYEKASDFLIGEMEQRRKQFHPLRRLFSIVGLYSLLSRYGTQPSRALFWLLFISAIHMGFSYCVTIGDLTSAGLRTLEVLTLQKVSAISIAQGYIDAGLRLLSPVFIALLVISIRARIKRF